MGGQGLSYYPAKCLSNFPLPHEQQLLEQVGLDYEESRSKIIAEAECSLTTAYNNMNSSDLTNEMSVMLRKLHVTLDEAVLTAYRWDDLDLGHGFHETKQGIRFTISEDARREVLQRLLKLNHERYEEEVAQGLHGKNKTSTPRKKNKAPAKDDGNMDLFNFMNASTKGSK